METKTNRLYFIDAIRAWAILMMLQGHFVDGLLAPAFRDPSNLVFAVWEYFRGITAPVFFTVSGFIFTYLLVRVPQTGLDNPRVYKGLKRGLQLVFIGYLLRLNFFGLLLGEIYPSFYLVDVLQCIGLSIIGITGLYLLTSEKHRFAFPALLLGSTLLLFFLEPAYKMAAFPLLPDALENYLTKVNGSVFTIIPWFGYSAFGAFLSLMFSRFRESRYLFPVSIGISVITGVGLLLSSPLFLWLAEVSGMDLFYALYHNNYLFIRLGNVLLIFALFMALNSKLRNKTILRLGQNTLSIYVIHFVILYGSLTGLGLYYYLNNSLAPAVVIPGAVAFMLFCSYAALQYDQREEAIKQAVSDQIKKLGTRLDPWLEFVLKGLRNVGDMLVRLITSVRSR